MLIDTQLMQNILLGISVVLSIMFFPYGLNFYLLMKKATEYKTPSTPNAAIKYPVTVQLPIFNERYVVERLVNACTGMTDLYGKDLVQILVLDDSTDETTSIAQAIVDKYKAKGYDIDLVHRDRRHGFKAGALQNALTKTKHPFISIFDADFVPPPDFLVRAMPHFSDEKLAIVQCKWGHLNRDYNLLTRAIAIGYDGHHIVEQTGRTAGGFLLNFNGAAGIIRRSALEQAGGWQADTLAEDLDASYRMQLLGWKAVYIRDIECMAEIPPTIPAVKRQQARWARGSMRTFRKLGSRIMRDKALTIEQKIESLIHLSYYTVHPLMFSAFIVALIAAVLQIRLVKLLEIVLSPYQDTNLEPGTPSYLLWLFSPKAMNSAWNAVVSMPHWIILNITIFFCSISMWIFYAYALKLQGIRPRSQLKPLGALGLIGFGISVSNTVAVMQGLLSRGAGMFSRTPKYKIETRGDTWHDKKYQIRLSHKVLLEMAFGILGILGMAKAFYDHNFGIIPILFLYSCAYLYVARLTIKQAARS